MICAVAGAFYVVYRADYWAVAGTVTNSLGKTDVTHVTTIRAERKWASHEAARWTGNGADGWAVGSCRLDWKAEA